MRYLKHTILNFVFFIVLNTGKFGVVYKAYYTSEEHKVIEVAVKTVKGASF